MVWSLFSRGYGLATMQFSCSFWLLPIEHMQCVVWICPIWRYIDLQWISPFVVLRFLRAYSKRFGDKIILCNCWLILIFAENSDIVNRKFVHNQVGGIAPSSVFPSWAKHKPVATLIFFFCNCYHQAEAPHVSCRPLILLVELLFLHIVGRSYHRWFCSHLAGYTRIQLRKLSTWRWPLKYDKSIFILKLSSFWVGLWFPSSTKYSSSSLFEELSRAWSCCG